jgi:hypothetical protein
MCVAVHSFVHGFVQNGPGREFNVKVW